MSSKILSIRPPENFVAEINAALEKFKSIYDLNIGHIQDTVNRVADNIETGEFKIIFLPSKLAIEEALFLKRCLEKTVDKPYIITTHKNKEEIQKFSPKGRTCIPAKEMNYDFIFSCFKNILAPSNYQLKTNYLSNILTGILDVIKTNTECQTTPEKTSETNLQDHESECVSIICFYGGGIYGSIIIDASKDLIQKFGSKILMCQTKEIKKDLLIDLFGELANQILESVRDELNDYSFHLKRSMQLVVLSENFTQGTTFDGCFYQIPFKLDDEKFNVTLCYNTYTTSINELETSQDATALKENILDIRLVNSAHESFDRVIKETIKVEPGRSFTSPHKHEIYNASSFYVIHGGGWQGEFSMGVEIPETTRKYLIKKLEPELEDDLDKCVVAINHLIAKIGRCFIDEAKGLGYSFRAIYAGRFASKNKMETSFKNPGTYIRTLFFLESNPLILSFGIRSNHGEKILDAWPLIKNSEEFKNDLNLRIT